VLHEQAAANLRELQHELSTYRDKLDLDPTRLRELEERVDLVQSLKRKYGHTVAEVIAFGFQAAQKLASLEQRDAELARLHGEFSRLDAELHETGSELSSQRRKLIPKLRKSVMKQLTDLGFKQCGFDVALTTPALLASGHRSDKSQPASPSLPLSPSGFDVIEFLFTPNVGEPPRPLRAIASSGEIARVMLALKTVLAAEDEVPVLVFDEVDANVGGETAHAVGEKMRQIARQRQVLCITHLAPVAAAASTHFQVTKEVKAARTLSEIKRLLPNERVEELARMLGGQSEAARRHAETLLDRNLER
jgi:DNA repair protein RecN (Recombination protein N)